MNSVSDESPNSYRTISTLVALGVCTAFLGLAALAIVPKLIYPDQLFSVPDVDQCLSAASATPSLCEPLTISATKLQAEGLRATSQNGVRQSIGIIAAAALAAIAAGAGVLINQRNLDEGRRQYADTTQREMRRSRESSEREMEHADDARFTACVDQLGHAAASVRVGALHALYRLAISRPDRAQIVIDVLCAYLRQPFHHPANDWNPEGGHQVQAAPRRAWWPASEKEKDARDGEYEVRKTAVTLITNTLPRSDAHLAIGMGGGNFPSVDLNLQGAVLDGLDLKFRRFGRLNLTDAQINQSLDLSFAHAARNVFIASSEIKWSVDAYGATFDAGLTFLACSIKEGLKLTNAKLNGTFDFAGSLGGTARFDKAQCRDKFDISFADFSSVTFSETIFDGEVILGPKSVPPASLGDATFNGGPPRVIDWSSTEKT